MELNSYIQPSAFSSTTVEELEQCFREINDVVSTEKMLITVLFQYNSNLLMSVKMSDGKTLAERLYSLPMSDRQLQIRVIPKLLSMIPDTSNHYDDIEQMKKENVDNLNSFWGIRFPIIKEYCLRSKDECVKYISDSLWNLMNAATIDWLYPLVLPNIIIADSALEQIQNLGASNNFSIVIEDLKKLNSYCESWTTGPFSINELRQLSAIDTTDESNSIKNKNNLKSYRRFQLKDIGTQYCLLHVKHGDFRLHYFPDEASHKIHIGYVGTHLPI